MLQARTARTGNIIVETPNRHRVAVVDPSKGGKILFWDKNWGQDPIYSAVRKYLENPRMSFNWNK
jgi:hypothetical protein